ncbi:MAG: response regulator [Dehalococcoidia bacterium]
MTRVLIVDYDQTIVRMLRLTLHTSGFDVETAHDAETAFAALDREPPDAIILDLAVGEIPAERFVREIRRHGCVAPIIVTSAAVSGDRRRLGADAFIPKPFRPDAVIEAVAALTHYAMDGAAGG